MSFCCQRALKSAYRCCTVLKRKRWAKVSLLPSEYFFRRLLVFHSRSAGGFLEPPPKNTSYSTLSRRRQSSSKLSSSSMVKCGTPRSRVFRDLSGLYHNPADSGSGQTVTIVLICI